MMAGIVAGGWPLMAVDAQPTDPYWASVVSLLHADGADGSVITVDSSPSGHSIAAQTGARLSATQQRFGGTSMKFNGSGASPAPQATDAFIITSTPALAMDGGDFTIEGWVHLTTTPASFSGLIDFRPAGGNGAYPMVYVDAARKLVWFTQTAERISGGTVPLNTWAHWAAVRGGGVTRLYLDGVQVGSNYTDANNYLTATSVVLGSSGNNSVYGGLGGYLDEIRVSKGVARYTANFTPPTTAFPNS